MSTYLSKVIFYVCMILYIIYMLLVPHPVPLYQATYHPLVVVANSFPLPPTLENCTLPKGKLPHQRIMSWAYIDTADSCVNNLTSKVGKEL